MALVNYHDTTFSPAGLWNFNNDLTDSSGNGFTLTVGSGVERYADISPGVRGLVIDGATYVSKSSFTSTLGITGDMTIEMLLVIGVIPTGSVYVTHVGSTSGESSADNYLYQFTLLTGSSPRQQMFWETGAGTNITYQINDTVPFSGLCHWAVTRTSGVVQFYVNGRASGAASTSLTSPTDGTGGTFKIGSDATSPATACTLASVKVVASALSATNIKSEYLKTLGGLYVS